MNKIELASKKEIEREFHAKFPSTTRCVYDVLKVTKTHIYVAENSTSYWQILYSVADQSPTGVTVAFAPSTDWQETVADYVPIANSQGAKKDPNCYRTRFMELATDVQDNAGKYIRPFQARAEVARAHPELYGAAFSQDAEKQFISAVEFEMLDNKLTLDMAYQAVASKLPKQADKVAMRKYHR